MHLFLFVIDEFIFWNWITLCVNMQVADVSKLFAAVCVQHQVLHILGCGYLVYTFYSHWGLRDSFGVHPRFLGLFVVDFDWGYLSVSLNLLFLWLGLRLWLGYELPMRLAYILVPIKLASHTSVLLHYLMGLLVFVRHLHIERGRRFVIKRLFIEVHSTVDTTHTCATLAIFSSVHSLYEYIWISLQRCKLDPAVHLSCTAHTHACEVEVSIVSISSLSIHIELFVNLPRGRLNSLILTRGLALSLRLFVYIFRLLPYFEQLVLGSWWLRVVWSCVRPQVRI